jgi:hypothetical protein
MGSLEIQIYLAFYYDFAIHFNRLAEQSSGILVIGHKQQEKFG